MPTTNGNAISANTTKRIVLPIEILFCKCSRCRQVRIIIRVAKATIVMLDKDLFNTSPDKTSQIAKTPKRANKETEAIKIASVIFLIVVKTGLEKGKDPTAPALEAANCSRESINLPAIITITATIESKPNVLTDLVITSSLNIFQTPQIEIAVKITTEAIKTCAAPSCIFFMRVIISLTLSTTIYLC